MVEMLFIHPFRRGQRLGTLLLDHATNEHAPSQSLTCDGLRPKVRL